MDHVTLNHKEWIQPVPLEETIYYKRASAKISEMNILISFLIHRDDLPFWKMMITDRIKCAREWMVQSDNYELHESDLSMFSELLHDVTELKPQSIRRKEFKLTLSLYKIHSVLGALEIQSHESMYAGRKKEYQLACKYIKLLQDLMKPYQSLLRRIDEVLLGRAWK